MSETSFACFTTLINYEINHPTKTKDIVSNPFYLQGKLRMRKADRKAILLIQHYVTIFRQKY